MSIKMTLLQLTQSVMSDMGSDEIDQLGDSSEAMQVARVIEDTFYNLVLVRELPRHQKIFQLESLHDSERPTHLLVPEHVKTVLSIAYNLNGSNEVADYRELKEVSLPDFVRMTRATSNSNVEVFDLESKSRMYIRNDRPPTFFTLLSNTQVLCDAFEFSKGSTLQVNRTRAYGQVIPDFKLEDDFIPDLDPLQFPLLLNEAKAAAFSTLLERGHGAAERNTQRYRSYLTRDEKKTGHAPRWNAYGR